MQTKTLQQTVTFKASPQEVYDMLMDSKKHRSFAWGSHLSGINLVLKPGKKIVQAWRATGWWPDHYSHRNLRNHQSTRRLEAQVYADRHPTQPLQRPLPWLDRDLLDANEGNIRDGSD
jgi:uncharacterized protein YndB with AHSA1/START domain